MNSTIVEPGVTSLGKGTPGVRELNKWTEREFLDAFRFLTHFTVQRPDGVWKWSVNRVTIGEMNNTQDPDMKAWDLRVNETTSKYYNPKLQKIQRAVCTFLKRNPAFVTTEITRMIEGNNMFDWCLTHYTEIKTEAGGTAIVPEIRKRMELGTVRGKEVEMLLMEAQLKIVDIYWHIVNSIKMDEVKELSVKDKLLWTKEIAPLLKQNRIIKPANVNVFVQNKNDAAKLEKSLLDYAEGKLGE